MSAWLLDVNVLIALIDAQHTQSRRAREWFSADPDRTWLSCPLTQNGVIRIIAGSGYSAPVSIIEVTSRLRTLTAFGNHRFVADDVTFLDEMVFHVERITSSKNLTDVYLLALAAQHDAALATFDAKIVTNAVRMPAAEILLIP
jgi:toxin-antitoxin system PIN domain toxin